MIVSVFFFFFASHCIACCFIRSCRASAGRHGVYDVMFMGAGNMGRQRILKMVSRLVMSGNMIRDGDILTGT
jgi:hypothetical protein